MNKLLSYPWFVLERPAHCEHSTLMLITFCDDYNDDDGCGGVSFLPRPLSISVPSFPGQPGTEKPLSIVHFPFFHYFLPSSSHFIIYTERPLIHGSHLMQTSAQERYDPISKNGMGRFEVGV